MCLNMSWLLVLLSLFILSQVVFGQSSVNRTNPVGIDGENPLISAVEDANNVSMFCEIIFSGTTLIETQWFLLRSGAPNVALSFDNGVGNEFFENFMTSPNSDFRRTLTILTFNSSFNNAQIGCGAGENVRGSFDLKIISGPSMPRSVTVLNVGPDYVNISWVNPINPGTPVALHQYTVTAVSSVNTVSMTVTDVNTDDPDYVNTVVLYGLKPNTSYTITVQGISTVTELGDLMGDSSEQVSFNTTLGAPRFSSSVLVNSNGNLSVSWQFLHTGGVSISSITVQCFSTVDDELLPASAAPLATIIDCTGSVQCDTSTDIGPVTTGMNYSCIVTAENSVGFEDERRTNYVIANTGLPSEAVFISVVGGAGSARITLRVDHYGVTDASQFFFTITVYSGGSMIDQRTVSPDNINNPVNTLDIDGLPPGMVSFTISTSNIYGSPLTINNATTSIVTVTSIITSPLPSTTVYVSTTTASSSITPIDTPTTTVTDIPTDVTSSSDGLSGGVLAAIVIIVIVVVAIISVLVCAVVYLLYKLKVMAKAVDASKPIDIRTDVNEAYQLMSVPSSPTPATGSVLVQDNIAYQQIAINTKSQDTSTAIYETVYGQD